MSNELPRGWIEVELQDCVDVLDSQRVPVNSDERARRHGDVPYYGATGQIGWIDQPLFTEELLLIGEDGAPFFDKSKPISYIIRGKSWVNNHAHVLRAKELISSNQYLKHFLDSVDFHDFVNGTTRLKLTQTAMNRIPVRLAPLAEQRRIVAKLEKLSTNLEASQQRLAKVPILLQRFRQSVLAAACSGRLTAEWREENGESIELWRTVKVRDIADRIEYGYTASAKNGAKGPRFLRITDIQNGRVDWENVPTCDISESAVAKYLLAPGDIVFARTGATTGKSFLIRQCPSAVFASYLIRVQSGPEVLPTFLYLFFQSPDYWLAISENLAGNAQPNCNATKLGDLKLSLPSQAEQKEIVRRVEELFALADQIETRYAKAEAHVEKLTQSILATAFRGELVPQDPNDEPASVLLERIRQLTHARESSKRKTKRPALARV